jgi:uncharacterized protein YPO0396
MMQVTGTQADLLHPARAARAASAGNAVGEPEFGNASQFKLQQIETYNWGTFSDLRLIDIAPEGHLILGPSGSGKSTLLDGHTSLLTPPKWLDFNAAARSSDKASDDRSLVTYVRGAWAKQTADDGEKVKRYLRGGTTWSALAETYRDGTGKTIVLGRILWIKGTGCTEKDVNRLYFLSERTFSLRELQSFPHDGAGFELRKLKAQLPDMQFTSEFSAYQSRFMRLFGIASDRALRLLHKTQSAKDMGDLNKFLRDFMLDPPETFERADTLVSQFEVLNSAHDEVLTAREQIKALRPIREDLHQHVALADAIGLLSEERVGISLWGEQQKKRLLEEMISHGTILCEGLAQQILDLQRKDHAEKEQYHALLALQAGAGGNLLDDLNEKLHRAEQVRMPEVAANEARMRQACSILSWEQPASPQAFAQMQAQARSVLDSRGELAGRHELVLDELKTKRRQSEERFTFLMGEVRAMEHRASNMPSPLLKIREDMCRDLNLLEEDLPFAGELMQVRKKEEKWTGAIERVLGGFATSLLVEEPLYRQVASWIDRTQLGHRLFYLRMASRQAQAPVAQPAASSLIRKIELAPKHPAWLAEEIRRFDYACVETAQDLLSQERGVTLAGQVKHSRTRHEKDDRRALDDRRNWVLGFTNAEKLAEYKKEAQQLAERIGAADKEMERARSSATREQDRVLACQTLANVTWENTNLSSVIEEVRLLNRRINDEVSARPQLVQLKSKVEKQKAVWDRAVSARQDAQAELKSARNALGNAKKKLSDIPAEALNVRLTPTQEARLQQRLADSGRTLTADSVDAACHLMSQAISAEELKLTRQMGEVKNRIEQQLLIFCTKWPLEANGLDAKLEAAQDFIAKLERLEKDGLDAYVDKFKKLLREQSNQNLAMLHAQLEQERRSIQDRMDQVNQSLRKCSFNEGTYLVIDYRDRPTQEVIDFRAELKGALAHSFNEDDEEVLEQRFAALNRVIQRLASGRPEDEKWKKLVLDVRQHVDFTATEFDASRIEVEVYDSGAGKSGGQRQKLTTTVLAAALRYQLAGEEGVWPTYSTVVMDEAFDKADGEFTAMVMTIFKHFGFQVVAATPVKNVMSLEPFIGGGTFISIQERKYSASLAITYSGSERRLDLPLEAREAMVEELASLASDDEKAALV